MPGHLNEGIEREQTNSQTDGLANNDLPLFCPPLRFAHGKRGATGDRKLLGQIFGQFRPKDHA